MRYAVDILCIFLLTGCAMTATKGAAAEPTGYPQPISSLMITMTPDLNQSPVLTPEPSAQHTNEIEESFSEAQKEIPGNVYLVLREKPLRKNFVLARLPAACLLPITGCPPMEVVINEELYQEIGKEMVFPIPFPDHETFVFIDQKNVLSFNAATHQIRTITNNFPANHQFSVISPDGKWVAFSAQSEDTFYGIMGLLNLSTGEIRTLWMSPNDSFEPIGWLNEHELLIQTIHHRPPEISSFPTQQTETDSSHVDRFNMVTGESLPILKNASPQSGDLSPNRKWLFYKEMNESPESQPLKSINLENHQIFEYSEKTGRSFLGWSPDSQWIAILHESYPWEEPGYSIYISRPDGTEEKRVFGLMDFTLLDIEFFINQNYFLFAYHANAKEPYTTNDLITFFIIPTDKNPPDGGDNAYNIFSPGLDQEKYEVFGVIEE
jgi:hypothetical protein